MFIDMVEHEPNSVWVFNGDEETWLWFFLFPIQRNDASLVEQWFIP